jgi:transmembrane sensor
MPELTKQQIRDLADKLLKGIISEKERALFEEWYNQQAPDSIDWIKDTDATSLKERLFQSIQQEIYSDQSAIFIRKTNHIGWRRTAAAIVILAFGIGGYFVFFNKPRKEIVQSPIKQQFKKDIAPGSNKAMLTLSNGSTIILDSAHNGMLAKQGNSKILKLNSGQLAYNTLNEKPTEVLYNILKTPRGGQYQLQLPDGTHVWLNASSSIKYPTAFTGKKREVEITGEAYFQIAKNPRQPFIVTVNGMEVQALGTEFNINSYNDEASVNTTLIEGSVKVTSDNVGVILGLDQQSQLKNGRLRLIKKVNTEEITSWKEGLFHFESADLKAILRQFSRWYDVDVVYEGEIKNRKFFGIVSRSSTLLNVLEMLKDNDIVFRIEDKKLIVKAG